MLYNRTKLFGRNISLYFNTLFFAIILIIIINTGASEKQIIDGFLINNEDLPAIANLSGDFNSHEINISMNLNIINSEVIKSNKINHNLTNIALKHEDILIYNNSELMTKVYYLSENLWNQYADPKYDEILLYNFNNFNNQSNLQFYLKSENRNYNFDVDNINFLNTLPSIASPIGIIMSPIEELTLSQIHTVGEIYLFFKIDRLPTHPLDHEFLDIDETDWEFKSEYYVYEDFIQSINKIDKIKEEIQRQMISLSIPWSSITYKNKVSISSDLYIAIGGHQEKFNNQFTKSFALYLPIIIIMELILLFITYINFKKLEARYNLLYSRGNSHKKNLQVAIFSFITIPSLLFPLFYLILYILNISNNIIQLILTLLLPWLLLFILGSLWLIVRNFSKFKNKIITNQISNKEVKFNSKLLVSANLLGYIITLFFIIDYNFQLTSTDNDIDFSLPVFYRWFIISISFSIFIYTILLITKFSLKMVKKSPLNFNYKRINKNLGLYLVTFIFIVFLIMYISVIEIDMQTQIYHQSYDGLVGDYSVEFPNIDDNEFLFQENKFDLIDELAAYLPVQVVRLKYEIGNFEYSVLTHIVDLSLYQNYLAKYNLNAELHSHNIINSDVLQTEGIWVSNNMYNYISDIDQIKISWKNNSKVIKTNLWQSTKDKTGLLHFGISVYSVMSLEFWNNLDFLELSPYQITDQLLEYRILLELKSTTNQEKIKSDFTEIFEIPPSFIAVHKIVESSDYTDEDINSIRKSFILISVISGIFVGFFSSLFWIKDEELISEIQILYIRYNEKDLIKKIIYKFIISSFTVLILGVITGLLLGIFTSTTNSIFFQSQNLKLPNYFNFAPILYFTINIVVLHTIIQLILSFYIYRHKILKVND